jgi:hypothetical protein
LPPRLQGTRKSQRRDTYGINFNPCHIFIVSHFVGVNSRNDGSVDTVRGNRRRYDDRGDLYQSGKEL